MDVITTALTAAIADRGAGGAYEMLKARLTGKSPRVDEAIADLEQDAGSLSRQFAVSDALAAAGLAGDRYLRAAARNLVDEVERRRASRAASAAANQPSHAVLQVFFATDRQPTGDRHPARQFGAGRGELCFGSCEVSVPRTAPYDESALPTLLRLQTRSDAAGHAVLLRAEVAPREPFHATLAGTIAKAGAGGALVFVHGYRTSFEDAARRTAHIAYQLGFPGVPVLYSWPSQGRLSGYAVDESNVEWSRPALARFLADLAELARLTEPAAAQPVLLAHGMGARAVCGALVDRLDVAARLRQVILVAPDIDAGAFRREIAPALAAAGVRLALYASSQDMAPPVAGAMPAQPRGDTGGAGLLATPGIETIDAPDVDTGFVGDSPGVLERSALADIRCLLGSPALSAERPGLRLMDTAGGCHWIMNP